MHAQLRRLAVALTIGTSVPVALLSCATAQTRDGVRPSASPAAVSAPAIDPTGTTTVTLVRHAEKAEVAGNDPPLSAAGEARAIALADALATARIGVVLTTPFIRTGATAAPLLQRLGNVVPEVIPVAVPDHPQAVADAVLQRHRGASVLVVGHSNTIPAIIHALGGPALPDLCDAQYAQLFVLTIPARASGQPPVLVQTTYGTSDRRDAASCSAAGATMKP